MELQLISDCNSITKASDYDKIFKVSGHLEGLADCKHSVNSPLRDRVVIEVVSSMPEVQLFLNSVKKYIDAELIKRCTELKCAKDPANDDTPLPPKPDLCRVQVCVSCSTGTHVSLCCIERLHEVYTTRKTPCEGLVVSREHKQATAWAKKQRSNDYLLWQCTKLPVTYFHSVQELTEERMWSPFPMDLSLLIEEQFQRDPFNTQCEMHPDSSKNTHLLNFATGEVYSIRERKTYKLRCTSVHSIQCHISCSMLDRTSYRSISRHYKAAGILFYTFHPVTGETVFLLGHMTYSCESWCDFGGLKSYRERPGLTAAREASEETLGVLGSENQLQEMLGNYRENNAFKVVNQNTGYVCFFLRVPYGDYPDQFMRALLDHEYTLEVDKLRWFSLSSLSHAMNLFSMEYEVRACPIFEDGSVDHLTSHPMRYEFVQTLCIAQKLDILHNIQHITQLLFKTTQQHDHLEVGSRSSPEHSHSRSSPEHCTVPMNLAQKVESVELQSTMESKWNCISEACPAPGRDSDSKAAARGLEEGQDDQRYRREVKAVVDLVVAKDNTTRCRCKNYPAFKFGIGAGKIS